QGRRPGRSGQRSGRPRLRWAPWGLAVLARRGGVAERVGVAPMMILVVEDDPDSRQAIGEYLSTLFPSARVVMSESGENALALARRIAPRVVLLDLRLGGMHGFEFATHLRQHPATTGTAIVALTGDTRTDTLLTAQPPRSP